MVRGNTQAGSLVAMGFPPRSCEDLLPSVEQHPKAFEATK